MTQNFVENPKPRFTQIFIDGKFVDSHSGKTFSTINPCNEEVLANVQEGNKMDIDLAVRAARKAFEFDSSWRTMDASQRGRLMYALADEMDKDKYYIASLETADCGKLIEDSLGDVEFAISVLRYYAGMADKIEGRNVPTDGTVMSIIRKEPIGVVGGIVPWNYPFHLAMSKVSPVLCTGCTLVMKPAEQTPLTALLIGDYCNRVGIPAGVINIVPGYGETAGAALTEHPSVNKILFTGSTEVGHLIMKASGESNIKSVGLELGGKSPMIVCADAENLEEVSKMAYMSATINAGQCCVAATRTFVEASIYDKFLELCKKAASSQKVGNPFDKSVTQGPQIDETQTQKIVDLIESGKKEGAKLLIGGSRITRKGCFVEPTVFADVTDDMRIAKEEIFGPVQSILKFATLDEAIERANDTHYGLGAAIFTSNIDKALTASQRLMAGTVWVNTYMAVGPQTPFGGFKESGIGRDFGLEGVACLLETKTITIALKKKSS